MPEVHPIVMSPRQRFVPVAWRGDKTDPETGLPMRPPPQCMLTVDLGNELLRCVVREVIDPDTVVVEITTQPFTKNHPHRHGDFVGARRVKNSMGTETWQAVDARLHDHNERLRQAAEAAEQAREADKAAAAGAEAARAKKPRERKRKKKADA